MAKQVGKFRAHIRRKLISEYCRQAVSAVPATENLLIRHQFFRRYRNGRGFASSQTQAAKSCFGGTSNANIFAADKIIAANLRRLPRDFVEAHETAKYIALRQTIKSGELKIGDYVFATGITLSAQNA